MGVIATKVVIANGASLSDALDTDGLVPCAIQFPSAWTAASITFQGSTEPRDYSRDGVTTAPTFTDVYDSAGEVSYTTSAASRLLILTPTQMKGFRQLKIRSGTAGAAVNQGAARTLTVLLRPED